MPAEPLHQVGPAEHQPGLGAAEQLVAAAQHQVRAGRQGGLQVGLVGQGRVRCSRPEPTSATTGTPIPASSPTSTDRVNPRTTKFDGWIFSTAPVSGPRAAV